MPIPFRFCKRRLLPHFLARPAFLAVLLLICPLLAGPAGTALAKAPLPVVVSIAPQKYLLERIAGERVAVTVLVKPGADPHSYEPSPAQMRFCAAARAWFTIGVPFEDVWLPRIQSAAPNLTVISTISRIKRLRFADDALLLADLELIRKEKNSPPLPSAPSNGTIASPEVPSTRVDSAGTEEHHVHTAAQTESSANPPASGHTEEAHADGEDPHVWLSPMLVRDMLPNIAKEMGKLLPQHATEFRAKAETFAAELEELDGRLADRFSEFPREKRVFLTFHPSWRYFAHNYGLTELSIEVEGKEPGPQSMKDIVDAAKAHGIRSIFIEPQFPKAAAQAIADTLGATVVVIDPLAEDVIKLYTDVADKLLESFK